MNKKKKRFFYEQHLNTARTALMEQEQHGEVMHGFTDNYIKVTMPFNTEAVNNLVEVQLSTIDTEGNVIALQLEESN